MCAKGFGECSWQLCDCAGLIYYRMFDENIFCLILDRQESWRRCKLFTPFYKLFFHETLTEDLSAGALFGLTVCATPYWYLTCQNVQRREKKRKKTCFRGRTWKRERERGRDRGSKFPLHYLWQTLAHSWNGWVESGYESLCRLLSLGHKYPVEKAPRKPQRVTFELLFV